MAFYSGARGATGAGSVSVIDTILLTKPCRKVTVTNMTSTGAPLYFRVSSPGGSNPQPTVGGEDCFILPAAIGSIEVYGGSTDGVIVNLISASVSAYAVSILQ
jgi:hypothetical protein